VDEVGERPEFLFEPIEGLLAGPAKGFQGHPAAPLAIERLVDDAERAGPEPASQLETPNARKVFRPEAAHQSSPLRTEIRVRCKEFYPRGCRSEAQRLTR
jgi:hypothetical protein